MEKDCGSLLKSKAIRDVVVELFVALVNGFTPFDDAEHQGSTATTYKKCIASISRILNEPPKDIFLKHLGFGKGERENQSPNPREESHIF